MQLQKTPTGQDPCGKCVIVAEADHRIANHLAILSGLVRQKLSSAGDGEGQSAPDGWLALNAVRLQLDAVAALHRTLTHHAETTVDVDSQLQSIASSFSKLCGERIVIKQTLGTGAELFPEHLLPLTQIVSEVLTNAVKHAGRGQGPGRIAIRSRLDVESVPIIEIADDGPGLAGGFDPTRDGGTGFRIIRSSARILDAAFEFHSSDAGLCFRLILPRPDRGKIGSANGTTRS